MAKEMEQPKEIVPFHTAVVKTTSKDDLYDGRGVEFNDGEREVQVHKIRGESGLAVIIYCTTDDGKRSELAFALRRDSAIALSKLLELQTHEEKSETGI